MKAFLESTLAGVKKVSPSWLTKNWERVFGTARLDFVQGEAHFTVYLKAGCVFTTSRDTPQAARGFLKALNDHTVSVKITANAQEFLDA